VSEKLRDILEFTARLLRRCANMQYRRAIGARESLFPLSYASFTGIIDAILEANKQVHFKQRHTAVRILERLRDEHGFTGGIPSYATMSTKLQLGKKRCSCHWRTCLVMRRWVLVRPMAILAVNWFDSIISALIYPIRMVALSKPIRLKTPNRFWMGMWLHLRRRCHSYYSI
jgi:hypothetical protein